MATKFESVYKAFLNSVDSYDLAQISQSELEQVLWGYLDSARIHFITYHKDLFDVDMDKQQFNIDLDGAEVTMVAKGMKLEWVSLNKNSQEMQQKSIGDRDYQAQQGHKYLEQLSKMERQLKSEIQGWINQYEYANEDLYGQML